jgi:hypothetical protein
MDGQALYYVKNQTEEICLAAVKQNGLALYYVKKQTENLPRRSEEGGICTSVCEKSDRSSLPSRI